ncbi:MAG: SDR family NAD(P)-dependent oxidoreductase [Acidimicrobiia bacterium]|nr:SDR family NAD(P)-dependent oxidoreductase [Acidimicrobiia bacterium]
MGDVEFDFSERVAAVTGGATGIGAAVVAKFARARARVYSLDIDQTAGESTTNVLEGAVFIHCDVTDPTAVDAAFQWIAGDSGRLDILVNNAGGFSAQRSTEELPLEEWQRVIDLNLTSLFLTSRAAIPLLRASSTGRIVNIGSLAGQTAGYTTSPPYAAAKAAVHALSRVMAHELAPDGITVNTIAPSAVMTERIHQIRDQAERDATAKSIPLGRYQTPDELAAWVLFLASREAGYLTGQTIAVNGGRFMA